MSEAYPEMLRLRVPTPLADALDRKAQREMLTRSAYVRRVLAADLGLFPADNGGEQGREEARQASGQGV